VTHWDELRLEARRRRAEVLGVATDAPRIPSARAVLESADRLTGIERLPLPHDDALLGGALATLDYEQLLILIDDTVEERLACFYQAHEYAHFWLHGGLRTCAGSDLDPEAAEEAIPLGVERVEGYGPLERREREANVFAREFLLPTDALRRWFVEDNLDAGGIAERVALPEGLVMQQLARALLTPEIGPALAAAGAQIDRPLDPSQAAAASAPHGPLLVRAGPGTGKTRTLVGRVTYLLEVGALPESILALTFSNRAAEEMRARLAVAHPDVAQRIWMGTFHAFGLELLRKYGSHLGLPPRPTVLDPVDAIALLQGAWLNCSSTTTST
jgi:Zn-dependent peptidase ImmA (M78 family)